MANGRNGGVTAGADKPLSGRGPVGRPGPARGRRTLDAGDMERAILDIRRIADGIHEGTVAYEYSLMCSDVSELTSAPDVIGADRYFTDACGDALNTLAEVARARSSDGADVEDHAAESGLLHSVIARSVMMDIESSVPADFLGRLGIM